jgi:hypothetical protein
MRKTSEIPADESISVALPLSKLARVLVRFDHVARPHHKRESQYRVIGCKLRLAGSRALFTRVRGAQTHYPAHRYSMSISRTRFCWRMIST